MKHLFTTVLLLLAATAFAQNRTVVGFVTDKANNPLPGATILKKSETLIPLTSTDGNGRFTIQAAPQDVIVVRMIGYSAAEAVIGSKTQLSIALSTDAAALQEVVMVGYGTQRKKNVTGAVSQIDSKVLENRPMPNLTRGLQGVIPNLNISMRDGKPTRGATYNVRGITSIGQGGSALVLIDGVEGNPDLLNPSDVESITVLKDAASAAIYGARGSFGVVLITTKNPQKGRTAITFNSSFSANAQTLKPKFQTDGYKWANTFNDAFVSWNDYSSFPQKANAYFLFSQQYLAELKKRSENGNMPSVDIDPATGRYVYYGNTDWYKELYSDRMLATDQQLTVSSSTDKASYYVSGRYNTQGGLFRYNTDKYKAYNLRAKGSLQLFPWLKVEDDLTFNQYKYYYPTLNSGNTGVWRRITDENFPIAMFRNPDGSLTENAAVTFGSFLSGTNYIDSYRKQTRNLTQATANLLNNHLKLTANYAFDISDNNQTWLFTPVPYSVIPGQTLYRGENKKNETNTNTKYQAANIYGEYNNRFGPHALKALVGYNYEKSNLTTVFVERDGLIDWSLPSFSLADGQNFNLTEGGQDWLVEGGFFRVNYGFNDKYLLEVNGRYDGTSKFPKTQQFAFFPSVSAGWRVSEEDFWKNNLPGSSLKLRASYGRLGNGNISPYQFLQLMNVAKLNRIIGTTNPSYTSAANNIPDGLTWEKATTLNLGADVSVLQNRLSLTADYYIRKTTGMFTAGLPVPQVFGADVPKGNYADLTTKGFELELLWKDQVGTARPFKYDLRLTLADSRSVIDKFNNPQMLFDTYYKGMRVGEIWGLSTEGFFTSDDDVKNHASQTYYSASNGGKWLPGDIKFLDANGDGKINDGKRTVSEPGDYKVIGNTSPRYSYGFMGNFDWNNFFLSFFVQGIAKRDYSPNSENSLFWGPYNRPYNWQPLDVVNNMWSEQNPNAYFPRLRGYTALSGRRELAVPQTRYMLNAAYARLKNLTVGYNIPAKLLTRAKIQGLRVYFTGQNLFTWTPMFRHTHNIDPEMINGSDLELAGNQGDGLSYPMLKTYTVGLSITL